MIRSPAAATRTSFDRDCALGRMASEETFDVLVIGGGITGAGVALDAAARGLRTALVERGDFASGTSSQSSKLVHGGLRYLQQREFRLVYEALAERQRLLDNAPHLVTPLPFLIPLFGRDGVVNRRPGPPVLGRPVALRPDRGLAHRQAPPAPHPRGGAGHMPTLDARAAGGGVPLLGRPGRRCPPDADRRCAPRCVNYGAVAANYAPSPACSTAAPGGRGRRVGRAARARLDDGTEIRADVVVNATGVWTDEVRGLDEGRRRPATLGPAKGIHLTFPAATAAARRGRRRAGARRPAVDLRRAVGRLHLRRDHRHRLRRPARRPAVHARGRGLRARRGQRRRHLAGHHRRHHVGLGRAAAPGRAAANEPADRRPVPPPPGVASPIDGLVTVTGGKLTTYRRMAADTVDRWSRHLGRGVRRSPTRRLPLLGAAGSDGAAHAGRRPRASAWRRPVLDHLVGRYGSEARTVIAMIEADPSWPAAGARPALPAGRGGLRGPLRDGWTLDDVLARRTRALFLGRDASAAAAADVARLIAPELGGRWHADQEAADYRARCEHALAERRSGRQGDLVTPVTASEPTPTGASGRPARPAPRPPMGSDADQAAVRASRASGDRPPGRWSTGPPGARRPDAAGPGASGPLRSVAVDVPTPSSSASAMSAPSVDTDLEPAGPRPGRDWWPLTVGWALGGEVPALAAAVARPGSAAEVAAVLAVCHDAGVPVTATGGRSGVCGNAVPVFGGVRLDLTGAGRDRRGRRRPHCSSTWPPAPSATSSRRPCAPSTG